MSWTSLNTKWDAWRARGENARRQSRHWRRRLALFLAVVGPGLITSNVDNDAGGITTYSISGAQLGYALLWTIIPLTIVLYISEEMCARMGVVTGKGLSDLIREEFGFRSTFCVMLAGLAVDFSNTVAEFAGVAASMQIFGITKYIAVPIAAILVWVLVVRGTYRQVEKIFLVACVFYGTYIASAFLAKPNWLFAARETFVPEIHMNTAYLAVLIALIGTSVAPWQFFYIQASYVEKKVSARQYKHARLDVLVGSITCMAIVFFIIVCTAATLNASGHTQINDAADAAKALVPLAGRWAAGLFAFGLLNASLFSASVLPLSTAHVICEGLGFEAGIDHKFKDAKMFYGLYTALIVAGGGVILIPGAPLLKILFLSQVANGIWLPFVLVLILLLINRKELMGKYVNGTVFNIVAWVISVALIVVTLALVFAPSSPGG
jgi:NRAMP (natural resistance-associated macrophage protein)-like metal ion transporter